MLNVDHVHKEFGNVRAVRDVAFNINDGVTFGLLGPNGAGKTTTMRMILGILTPDGGTITWNGQRITNRSRRHFGYLPEERGIYGKMKVREQIVYFGKLHGMRDPEATKRTNEWIERLGVGEYAERPCSELSKGNQQKVQVACAAVHSPELLVLDEPFSGLDPVNADILLNVLSDLKKAGTTLVLSSHQMWQLEELCSEFCIIANGENRVSGTLAELRSAWPTRTIRVEPNTPEVRRVIASVNGGANGAVPLDTNLSELLRSLMAVAPITTFEAVEPSLHEIYLRAIGEGNAA